MGRRGRHATHERAFVCAASGRMSAWLVMPHAAVGRHLCSGQRGPPAPREASRHTIQPMHGGRKGYRSLRLCFEVQGAVPCLATASCRKSP
eukprot:350904-Chlamydomonas_euryale.AAC.1